MHNFTKYFFCKFFLFKRDYFFNNKIIHFQQINGTTIIKNETFVTQKTDLGNIVWHLEVIETRQNEQQKSINDLTVPTTTVPIKTDASTTTTPELKINFLPNIQRDTENDFSPEDIDNRQDNEFFDDIDGLEVNFMFPFLDKTYAY